MELVDYVKKFNEADEETVKQQYDDSSAYDFLLENAPRLKCPDEVIEETFAFREWTIRKHFRLTAKGKTVLTEFLPQVSWSGAENTINAALCHHLNEARWLKNSDVLKEYISFFLEGEGSAYTYFIPALYEMYNYALVTDNFEYLEENIDKLEEYFSTFEKEHLTDNGLYWSLDNYDAMEVSISGMLFSGEKYVSAKGIRPTLNSYMYGGATVLAKLEERLGRKDKAKYYREKAEKIKNLFEERLWDGSFFKAVHTLGDINAPLSVKDIIPENDCKELIGYIPWGYGLVSKGKEGAFEFMFDEKTFLSPAGLTTADISNPRFLYEWEHECLWNGYVWPFAISQAINSAIAVNKENGSGVMTNERLYFLIKKYAEMHYKTEGGKTQNWIDEVMHPYTKEWSSREWLKEKGWLENKGGYERGKDYNHSTFIDLVIRGLIGVDEEKEELTVEPRIKGIWKWFSLENFTFRKKTYNIYYTEDEGVKIEKVK